MHAYRATDVAAAESRGRAAGYAEAVQRLRQDADTEPADIERALRYAADHLEALAASATTEEPTP